MPIMPSKGCLYIVDAHGFLHSAYHALPPLTTSRGEEVGAAYGFTRFLLKLLREKKPEYLAVCFDSAGKTFRHSMYAGYKVHRPKADDALISQLKAAREITAGLGLRPVAVEGFEADDLLASLAASARAQGLRVVLVTSDKDACQLISEGVSIWTGRDGELRDADYVKAKYGIEPAQMRDYLAIVGDSSDNVPGVAGIGPKGAQKLIAEFGGLERIIEAAASGAPSMPPAVAAKIRNSKDAALLSKQLVTLNAKVPVPYAVDDFKVDFPGAPAFVELFKKYEFRGLLEHANPAASSAAKPKPALQFSLSGSANAAVPASADMPEALDWSAAASKVSQAKACFVGVSGGYAALGLSAGECAVKPVAALTDADRALIFNIVENAVVLKLGHKLKESLRECGYQFRRGGFINCFDTAVAAYCLNPSRSNFDLNAIAAEYLDKLIPAGFGPAEALAANSCVWELHGKLKTALQAGGLAALYEDIESPLISVLGRMEADGISIDAAVLKNADVELAAKMAVLEDLIDKAAGGHINANSPKQVAELLYEKLQIPSGRKTKTGLSTDEDVLGKLAAQYPVAGHILQFREASKLKSTYVDNLLALADSGARVHTHFNQLGTATGRLSSLVPNLQNIPVRTPQGRLIRKAFVSKAGHVLLSADYSQIDLRVLAHESGDKALTEAFLNGEDVHLKTACEVFAVMPALVTPEMRRIAKAINFGIVYGQSAMGLSQELDITRAEAQKYIDGYFATYSGVKDWIQQTIAAARQNGCVKTFCGRIRFLPEFKSGNGALAAFAQRAAVNTVVQGGSADIIKRAMIDIHRDLDAAMLLQVHDELIFEIPEGRLGTVAAGVKEKMERAAKLRVPLVADLKAGVNWQDMQPLALKAGAA